MIWTWPPYLLPREYPINISAGGPAYIGHPADPTLQ